MQNVNDISINGLVLPSYLIELNNQGRWKTPADTSLLRKITGSVGSTDFDLMQIEHICCMNRLTHLLKDPMIAQLYRLESSASSGAPILNPSVVDVDSALLIAMNYDDENLHLDYRFDPKNPRVVGLCWTSDLTQYEAREIAKDFRTFADYIGL